MSQLIANVTENMEQATAKYLRDHFAGVALSALLSSDSTDYTALAKTAYDVADAMLAQRTIGVQG